MFFFPKSKNQKERSCVDISSHWLFFFKCTNIWTGIHQNKTIFSPKVNVRIFLLHFNSVIESAGFFSSFYKKGNRYLTQNYFLVFPSAGSLVFRMDRLYAYQPALVQMGSTRGAEYPDASYYPTLKRLKSRSIETGPFETPSICVLGLYWDNYKFWSCFLILCVIICCYYLELIYPCYFYIYFTTILKLIRTNYYEYIHIWK